MVHKPVLWLKLPQAKEPEPESPDLSLFQEDRETRIAVDRYLRLADRLLSTDKTEKQQTDDDQAA